MTIRNTHDAIICDTEKSQKFKVVKSQKKDFGYHPIFKKWSKKLFAYKLRSISPFMFKYEDEYTFWDFATFIHIFKTTEENLKS